MTKTFASDNSAGVHPEILRAIQAANVGHAVAYGEDPWTEAAIRKFQEHFGETIDVYFVFNGTAANVLALKAITRPYHAILCTDIAHINVDECNAPEVFTGCKLIPIVPTSDGKLTVEQIQPYLKGFGVEHHAQPRVISITQPTELGTVYTPEEIRRLADLAHDRGLLLHMDGARLSNAAASLGTSLKAITGDVGVDVLSFGGTKNGMMFGEAVVFFDRRLSEDFMYFRKQGMQLGSKMRFIAAQFEALLSNDLWLRNARHANEMAQLLAQKVAPIAGQKVEVNALFGTIPARSIPLLHQHFYFYVWDERDEKRSEVRWMAAFDTTEEDVSQFAALLEETIAALGESTSDRQE